MLEWQVIYEQACGGKSEDSNKNASQLIETRSE